MQILSVRPRGLHAHLSVIRQFVNLDAVKGAFSGCSLVEVREGKYHIIPEGGNENDYIASVYVTPVHTVESVKAAKLASGDVEEFLNSLTVVEDVD
jgi:hypothetical protein